jgi:hypothetical protein
MGRVARHTPRVVSPKKYVEMQQAVKTLEAAYKALITQAKSMDKQADAAYQAAERKEMEAEKAHRAATRAQDKYEWAMDAMEDVVTEKKDTSNARARQARENHRRSS